MANRDGLESDTAKTVQATKPHIKRLWTLLECPQLKHMAVEKRT